MVKFSDFFKSKRVPLPLPANYEGETLKAYLDAASENGGDTRAARMNKIYEGLQSADIAGTWHRIPGLREFLKAHMLDNPYMPADLRKAWEDSKPVAQGAGGFFEDWAAQIGPIGTLNVALPEFMRTIDALPEEKEKFVKNNLHDHAYFFLKYAEWHVTREYQKRMNAKRVLDVGAAYHGFASTLCTLDPDVHVTMADLGFPAGFRRRSERIDEYGADAGDMCEIPANSVDLICSHNAFEHFAGDSDSRCVREFERILKPGGVALITPFFVAKTHSITLSPAPSFLFGASGAITQIVRDELAETGGRLDFNPNIVSPYARRYDINTYKSRIRDASNVFQFTLKRWAFDPKVDGDLSLPDHPDVKTPYDIFHKRHFCILEMKKPG